MSGVDSPASEAKSDASTAGVPADASVQSTILKGHPSSDLRSTRLRQAVDHAAHLLPAQGPIGVFVHHNTLHAFEHLPFEDAVLEAAETFGAEPYMAEAAYRGELARGRILAEDVEAVLDSETDTIVFPGLTRRSLRRAMITPGVREFDAATII